MSQEFNPEQFSSILKTQFIGKNVKFIKETTSTMDVAASIEKESPSGTLIIADSQTQGKGRVEGRIWSSKPKGNLYFTLILHFSNPIEVHKLNLCIPLAVVRACEEEGVKNIGVKWPNDVWVGYKKICGNVINVTWRGSKAIVHAGIGINVNEDMIENEIVRETSTSVFNSLGKKINREEFLARVCLHLENLFNEPFKYVMETYTKMDILIGKQIMVMPKKMENLEHYKAKAIGFTEEGYLKVKTVDGKEETLVAEEVTVRPEQNQ